MSEEKSFVPVNSAAQWKAIVEKLKGYFVKLRFRIGKTIISVQKLPVRENQWRLYVYIDGRINYSGLVLRLGATEVDPMMMLVYRRVELKMFPPSKLKGLSKRMIKKLGFDKTTVMYRPDYSVASSLVRKFRKIENIEVEW